MLSINKILFFENVYKILFLLLKYILQKKIFNYRKITKK